MTTEVKSVLITASQGYDTNFEPLIIEFEKLPSPHEYLVRIEADVLPTCTVCSQWLFLYVFNCTTFLFLVVSDSLMCTTSDFSGDGRERRPGSRTVSGQVIDQSR